MKKIYLFFVLLLLSFFTFSCNSVAQQQINQIEKPQLMELQTLSNVTLNIEELHHSVAFGSSIYFEPLGYWIGASALNEFHANNASEFRFDALSTWFSVEQFDILITQGVLSFEKVRGNSDIRLELGHEFIEVSLSGHVELTVRFTLTWHDFAGYVPPPVQIEQDVHIPIQVGQDFDLLSTLDSAVTIDFVNQQGLSFKDLHNSGQLTITALDTDDLDIPFALGTFRFIVNVVDDFDNIANLFIYVHTRDISLPVIHGDRNVTATNDTLLLREQILSDITITDNYDGDISTDNLVLVEDNYTPNFNRGGSWSVVFSVRDFSNNETILIMQIQVRDVLAPVFSGVNENITRDIDTELIVNGILGMLNAYDETDGDVTNRIRIVEDNFTGNECSAGTFSVIFSVSDLSDNVAYHTINITNLSNVPPVFVIDSRLIVVERGTIVTEEQLIDLLVAIQLIDIMPNINITIETNFFGNENVNGDFVTIVILSDDDGNVINQIPLTIRVQNDLVNNQDPYEPSDNLWFTPILNVFIAIWNFIVSIAMLLWQLLVWLINGVIWLFNAFIGLF